MSFLQKLFVYGFIPISCLLLHFSPACAISINNPFSYFNVYSLGDIDYHSSDFQGITGAGGDVTFTNFQLAYMEPNGYALHAGGNVNLNSGSYHGHIEAGSDIMLNHATVSGDIHSGSNIGGTSGGGTITGNAYAKDTVNLPVQIYLHGDSFSNTPYLPEADHQNLAQYFTEYSKDVSKINLVGGSSSTAYGKMTATLQDGINVFEITASELSNINTVQFTGSTDASVFFNVGGEDISINNWITWDYSNGLSAENVLLNYFEATNLILGKGGEVNILAPLAETRFDDFMVGSLIVGNLTGDGQINLGHFNPVEVPHPTPEPSTVLLLGSGLASMAYTRFRRRRRAV